MQLVCPYCNDLSTHESQCSHCNANIKWVHDLYYKSECYYTKGYEYAQKNNLTEAKKHLKKAIYLNKYHIEARNLLGVVEFECGNVGAALKYWVISQSIQKENNKAQVYLERIQQNTRKFQAYKDADELYNKAIKYLERESEDMAVIRLRRAIRLSPNFLEARNLLALCYIVSKQYTKAMEQISYVLQVDQQNPRALNYLKEVNIEELKTDLAKQQAQIEQQEATRAKIYYKPNRAINRGHSLVTAILYFAIGGVCMLGVQVGMIMPSKTAGLESQIYSLEGEKDQLEKSLSVMQEESQNKIMELQESLNKQKKYTDELQKNSNKLSQQQKLSEAKALANSREWVNAADMLYNIAGAELDINYRTSWEELKQEVYPRATDQLYSNGYSLYKSNKIEEARACFEKAILYGEGTTSCGKSLYYLGEIEEKSGNAEKAKGYYERVITGYEGHSAYYWAKNRLKNLVG